MPLRFCRRQSTWYTISQLTEKLAVLQLSGYAGCVIPTVHNVRAVERALRVAAERYVTADRVDMELERAVGRVVRAFDPCIARTTH